MTVYGGNIKQFHPYSLLFAQFQKREVKCPEWLLRCEVSTPAWAKTQLDFPKLAVVITRKTDHKCNTYSWYGKYSHSSIKFYFYIQHSVHVILYSVTRLSMLKAGLRQDFHLVVHIRIDIPKSQRHRLSRKVSWFGHHKTKTDLMNTWF